MNQSKFIEYLATEKNYSKHTVTAYKKDLEDFRLFCDLEYDIKSIDVVSYSIIRSWIVLLVNSGINNRSINRKMSSLKAYYKFLMLIGSQQSTPFAKHKALKITHKVVMPFSSDEMRQLLNEIPFEDDYEGIRDKLIIELLYATGIRRNELINLKIKNSIRSGYYKSARKTQ